MDIKINDTFLVGKSKKCFISFTEGENKAEFLGTIYSNKTIGLDKFINGNIGKYKFRHDDNFDSSFFFVGNGRGRKPQQAINDMEKFIQECNTIIQDSYEKEGGFKYE